MQADRLSNWTCVTKDKRLWQPGNIWLPLLGLL
jgi:hypothetical protein